MTNEEGVVDAGSGNNEPQTAKNHTESDSNASFLRAARAGNLDKVLEYLKGSIDINTSNANGLNALHLASKEGHVAVVTELVKRGANVNAATKKGNTALHIASLAGQEEVVRILIRSEANANVQSQNGFTPLYMAAQENHDAVVKFLLANGANQSLATEDGFTPLAVALQQGHDKVVAVLLENDAKGRVRLPALHIAAKKDDCKAAALLLQNDHDPDVTSKSGFTPLHIAAHYGNENIGSLLLEKNADVNYSAKHQITPLHVAAKWGKSNMVTLLVDKGAKIDASTRDGLTPLHCAARSGHDQVVDLLLEKGAPITAKTKNGLAPLHMASQGDHVDSARILLYHKAPVDDVTVDYLTALHVAAHCGHVRVAKLLLDRKADPNARALNGFTPLHIACKKNRIKIVELLLKHGASIEATTESGLTPLHVASFMGCMNIVIYLIQHGANPDVPTVRGETPLHLAARANQSDIIRILLRNGAHVDASAREQQTPLHIAARLGNVDIVGLLLQHGAAVDAPTKDMYTALHIAAKEGQEEVASVLLDHGASLTATTKKGFTPLHLAAKYGNIKVARLLLQKDAPVDAQGKNGVTPLHVAAHYDHVNVALLLLDKGAFPHATAKNGYTPLHIASKKNQMDIATTLLEYGAKPSAESKAGFTPLHLAAQEGHTDMTTLLIEHHADVNAPAKNGLSPLHLCAQEDKVNVAAILVKNGAKVDPPTKAGYTPLHVACHFGQINMIRFLLQHGADVNATTSHGYTPLHQAAQQGHTLIINLLLEHKASPNTTTNQGQTALSIAQRLGYISVVETLKIVTETVVTTTTTTVTEEKYKVVAPETMQETFMSDSEDEGGDDIEDTSLYGKPAHATHVYLPYIEGQKLLMTEDTMLGDQSFHYLTADEMKSLGDDSLPIDVTRDERGTDSTLIAPLTAEEDHLTPQHIVHQETTFSSSMPTDNVDLARAPVHAGFLVSFMVDARGGAMRGCRHSGVRVIIPPRKAPMPMRITCRYLRKEKLAYPPPLMEGEACASRILEVGPSGAKFLGPVIIEVPHFAALRGREREITILRSDNGETWREHTLEASDDAVHDVFNESFEGEELTALEDLSTNRITRILTTDFPQYFAIITRIRQEVHAIGPEGGMVSSTVVPQVQAIFPEGALTKKIKVGLQAQPITPELVTKLLGNRVAVSPIVTVEPRRRKFHKPITLTIPVPQAATKGMINQYSGDAPTLRLLCSITGGTTKAQWEDVTGSTPLTFVNDCVSFTTTVSARFWLMDCRQVNEATKFATELYREAIHVPFMAKFVVFAKRHDPMEAQLRVFCMTDDKEDKTLESQEHFTEVAKSRDVEVLEGKPQYLEFAGNLVPVTKSGEQLCLTFQAFRENRLPFTIRVKDPHQEPMGRVAFMREPRVGRGELPQSPICNLNIALPEADLTPVSELVTLEKKYGFVTETSLAKPELIHRADLRLSDIAKGLDGDWVSLALQLDLPESDINSIRSENPNDTMQQALVMLRHWLQRAGSKATGNTLEKGLRKINREDIVNQCMFNVELVTDDVEKAVAKVHLDQSGFDTFKEELGSSRDASLRRETSLNGTFDEQDIMKDAESAAETSSESSDKEGHFKSEGKPVAVTESVRTEIKDGVIERIVTRTTTKVVEDGPETLIQMVPTALAESFTQNLSNGQMSDTSVHEEDRSEPTIATLSSEATAEMDVSSLEDKSQAETHVEKRENAYSAGSRKCIQLEKLSTTLSPEKITTPMREHTLRYIKKFKKAKEDANTGTAGKKVSFDIFFRTMTPPVPSRKKKKILRRKSWPPESPLKLNRKKKYQKRLKVKNLREPFWTSTYDWLTMKCAPETLKEAPLANLTEFDDDSIWKNLYPKPVVAPYVSSFKKPNFIETPTTKKLALQNVKIPQKLTFYFTNPRKMEIPKDTKNYLKNLRNRCLPESLQPCEVRSLRPTSFVSALVDPGYPQTTNVLKEHHTINPSSNSSATFSEALDFDLSFDSYFPDDYSEVTFDGQMRSPFQEYYRPLEVVNERSSLRPLQSFNVDSTSNVLCSAPISLNPNVHCMKQKIFLKDKENVKISNISDQKEKLKPLLPEQNNYAPKIASHIDPGRNKFQIPSSLNYSSKSEKGYSNLPKNIPLKSHPKSIPHGSPNDMPNPNLPDSNAQKNVQKSNPSTSKPTAKSEGPGSTYEATGEQSVGDSSCGDTPILANQFQNQPLRKEDTEAQPNVASPEKKSENTEEKEPEAEKTKTKKFDELSQKADQPSKVLVEAGASQTLSEVIPATVLGQSFLKSLMEQHIQAEDDKTIKPFPASVIGQTFLNALLEQQNKMQESASNVQKTVPTSAGEPLSSKTLVDDQQTAEDKPVPSSVVGQAFLKSLIEEEANRQHLSSGVGKTIPATVVGQTFLKTLQQASCTLEAEKEKPIPASVIGQSFLKTVMECQLNVQEAGMAQPIPAPVIGQVFMKTLIDQAEDKLSEESSSKEIRAEQPIPAPVIGQAFLKNLIEQSESQSDVSPSTMPASAVCQAFLKTLIEQQPGCQADSKEDIVPAPLIGQAFLKTLLEHTESKSGVDLSQPIPAPVISQTFIKSLLKESENVSTNSSKVIPATVIGQSFIKTLSQQKVTESYEEQPIPAPVIGQSFLKTLMECHKLNQQYDNDSKPSLDSDSQDSKTSNLPQSEVPTSSVESQKTVSAAAIGQAFLKTLVEENRYKKDETKKDETEVSKTIPATVVGQSFLKALIQPVDSSPAEEKIMPATVVGQAFLKTLVESQKENVESSSGAAKPLPAAVIGQSFLKTLFQAKSDEPEIFEEKLIPTPVTGQSFLQPVIDDGSKGLPSIVPATVIGQAFLKTLVETGESGTSEEATVTQNVTKSITPSTGGTECMLPSSVIGQAFLKTLIQQGSSQTPESASAPKLIPSEVVGQSFLKSLIQSAAAEIKNQKAEKTTEALPATVDEQSLLVQEKNLQTDESTQKSIPAAVVGQAFLKTLTEQADTQKSESIDTKAIPSSVIGQAFLKSLFEQQLTVGPSQSQIPEEAKPTPASVIGQVFLKMLVNQGMQDTLETTVSERSPIENSQQILDKGECSSTSEGNGCSNGVVRAELAVVDSIPECGDVNPLGNYCPEIAGRGDLLGTIIPPPPEFSSDEDAQKPQTSSTCSAKTANSSEKEVTTGLIGELLSFTKMMQSVLGSMNEPENVHPDNVTSNQTVSRQSEDSGP